MRRIFTTERIVVALLIALMVLLVELQYIVGRNNTPAGAIYLGTVHYPPDYFYYLSQMVQGKERFLSSTMLYTGEKLPFVWVGWQHVLMGRIFSSMGFDIVQTYQLSVIFCLVLFLFFSYRLLCICFPGDVRRRLLAFFFFISSTSLPIVAFEKGGITLGFYSYWYNLGVSLSRFGPTPHHLIANTFAVISILLFIHLIDSKKIREGGRRLLIFFAVAGFLLASITPVHWVLVCIGMGLVTLIHVVRKRLTTFSLKRFMLPMLFFITGIPAALYVRNVFSMPPYSYSSVWEGLQQLNIQFATVLWGSGLITPFAFAGVFFLLKKINTGKLFGLLFVLSCSIFYFSSIPAIFHLTNARFWPATVYLFLAVFACEAFFGIAKVVKSGGRILVIILFAFYLASVIPSYILQYKEILTPHLGNAYYYLPKDAFDAYKVAQQISKKDDLFLVQWPFSDPFPPLTGRKSVMGFYLLTINSEEKDKEINEFFTGKKEGKDMQFMLKKYNISYIIGYPWNPKLSTAPFLKRVYSNSLLSIDKVVGEKEKGNK